MTNPNRSDITVLLDRSGSMTSVKSDVEGGFAGFLKEQRQVPGDCVLSLVQFDSEGIDAVYTACPIGAAPPLEFEPRSWTPLLDAVGRTLVSTGQRLAAMTEAERPGRVLFVIITDGKENASREFTKGQIKTMVERQTRDYQWQFLYLGANVDAFAEASGLGIGADYAADYPASPVGTRRAFELCSSKVASFRRGAAAAFSAEDRETLER